MAFAAALAQGIVEKVVSVDVEVEMDKVDARRTLHAGEFSDRIILEENLGDHPVGVVLLAGGTDHQPGLIEAVDQIGRAERWRRKVFAATAVPVGEERVAEGI